MSDQNKYIFSFKTNGFWTSEGQKPLRTSPQQRVPASRPTQRTRRPNRGQPESYHTCKTLATLLVFLFSLFSLAELSLNPKQLQMKAAVQSGGSSKTSGERERRWGSHEENKRGQEEAWQLSSAQKPKAENRFGDRWTDGSYGQCDVQRGFQVAQQPAVLFWQRLENGQHSRGKKEF